MIHAHLGKKTWKTRGNEHGIQISTTFPWISIDCARKKTWNVPWTRLRFINQSWSLADCFHLFPPIWCPFGKNRGAGLVYHLSSFTYCLRGKQTYHDSHIPIFRWSPPGHLVKSRTSVCLSCCCRSCAVNILDAFAAPTTLCHLSK